MQRVDWKEHLLEAGKDSRRFFQELHTKENEFLSILYTLVYSRHSINIFNQINKLEHEDPHKKDLCTTFMQFKVLKSKKGYSSMKSESEAILHLLFLL